MKFIIIALALVASCTAVPQRQRGNQQYQQKQYNQQQQQQQSQQYNQQPQQPQQYNQQPQQQQYNQQPRAFEPNPQPQPEQSFKQPISVPEYKPQPQPIQQEYRQSAAQQRADEYRPKNTLETTTWIPIIRFDKEQENDGSYKTSYETGNNIIAEETGFLKNVGESDREALVQHGSYTYTSPEGQLITVQYTADEFGFRATGDHIPTPPPVSPEIQKGLDLIYAGIKANQERLAQEQKSNPEAFAKKQADRAALDFTGQYYAQ